MLMLFRYKKEVAAAAVAAVAAVAVMMSTSSLTREPRWNKKHIEPGKHLGTGLFHGKE
jgi:hypothetical protein